MADTFQLINGAPVRWGTEEAASGTLLDSTVEDTAQYEKVENNQGAVIGLVIYDIETVVTLEIMAPATGDRPEIADEVTLGSVKAYVLQASEKATSKGTTKWSIKAHKWSNCAPAA